VSRCTARNFSPISQKFTGFGAFQGWILSNFPQLCPANSSYPARLVLGAILGRSRRHNTDHRLTLEAASDYQRRQQPPTLNRLAPMHGAMRPHVNASVI
jgi:hypothetical protein